MENEKVQILKSIPLGPLLCQKINSYIITSYIFLIGIYL